MKKVLIGLVVLIAIIAIGASILLSNLDGYIKDTIEAEGTAALGSQVSVGSVETDLANGKATIKGLSIANMPGYQAINAMQIDTLQADVDYQNRLVEEILIQQPIINAELKGSRSNFQDLVDNMPAAEEEGADDATNEEAAGDGESEATEISIKSFKLNQATVNVTSDKLGQMSFVMDDLEISNLIGTPEVISTEITRRLTNHISQQVQKFAADKIKSEVKAEVRAKANEKMNEVINEKVGDKLKGLKLKFGKD